MNPEEGELRPQITDRIGLRVFVRAAGEFEERLEIYRRNAAFARDRAAFARDYESATKRLRAKLAAAIKRVDAVAVPPRGRRRSRSKRSRGSESIATAPSSSRSKAPRRSPPGKGATQRRAERRRARLPARGALAPQPSESRSALRAPGRRRGDRGRARSDARRRDERRPQQTPTRTRDAPQIVVAPGADARSAPLKARPQRAQEGQPVATVAAPGNGKLDLPATLVDRAAATRAGIAPEAKAPLEAAQPPRLSILVVDASLSTQKSAELVRAASRELLRPIYTERERAALISCWGPTAEIVVDEHTGRNIDLVASRLADLEPGAVRALTPLAEALEHVRRLIGERFRRANPGAEVDVAIFSDGRANVPLGGETLLQRALARAERAANSSRSPRSNAAKSRARSPAART